MNLERLSEILAGSDSIGLALVHNTCSDEEIGCNIRLNHHVSFHTGSRDDSKGKPEQNIVALQSQTIQNDDSSEHEP